MRFSQIKKVKTDILKKTGEVTVGSNNTAGERGVGKTTERKAERRIEPGVPQKGHRSQRPGVLQKGHKGQRPIPR